MQQRVKVMFIAGSDRSGSTMLDLMLGSVRGFTAVGELSNLWQRGVVEGRLCGCGAPVPRCDVWRDVLASVFGRPPSSKDVETVLSMRTRWLRARHTLDVLRGRPLELGRYLDVLSRLYTAIAERTEGDVVVDSSKDAVDAAALLQTPGIDAFVVHLVRDPRAVAYSLGHRPKRQPDTAAPSRMATRGALKATVDWAAWNVGAELVTRSIPERSVFLRYEDLVRAPRACTTRLLRLAGSDREVPFVEADVASLSPSHTVSGNPSRFATGTVTVRMDDEWRRRQSARDRMITTLVATPLLRRYGYPIIGGRGPQG